MNFSISAKDFQASTVHTPSPTAIVEAGTRLADALAQGRAIETAALRAAMEAACGGSDAGGLWLWKDAYEAGEVAQVLFLRRFWPAIQAKATIPAARLAMLARIAGMLPTHTRRSEESESLQQFSTPLPIGYVAALACGLRPGEALLEPSAGTGLLAIHAELAGARLHLNELAATRAGLLKTLYPAACVTQLDAAQIHDRLADDVAPGVVLMNPPFSVAAHVEGRYRDATGDHLRSALSRLPRGGRLVAITGESFRPDRPAAAKAFAELSDRGGQLVFSAGLSGRAYAKHGTTVDVRLSVFDRLPDGEAGPHIAPLGLMDDPAGLLAAVLAHVPARLEPASAPARLEPVAVPVRRVAIPGLSRKAGPAPRALPSSQVAAAAAASVTAAEIAYDPCGSNTKAQGLYTAMTGSPAARRQIVTPVRAQPGRYADPKDWVNDMTSGAAPDGAALYSGDAQGASKFINAVVGPPDSRPQDTAATATSDRDRLEKTGKDTYRSMTAVVLADIAADFRPDGPIAQARNLSTHWQGNDGGAAWAAGVAGQHDRGIIQDAVRMEAANLALLAHQIKRGMRTEATAAALLLAMVNARLTNSVPAVNRGSLTPASFQAP
ncbi:hypothetical protein [Methylobacterium aquaticum]|uniref:hypothetical protein n=1 Tax=Methylobacterium aquaticum TaxID=270351 RepID=UPI001FEE68FD|nr:hypothetical protein [Methylobacterium aquaticum]